MADQIPDWARVPKQNGFVVEARHPDGKTGRVALDDREGILFGRNGQVCDCEVAHKSASRVHACLAYDGGMFQIQDLASSHGISSTCTAAAGAPAQMSVTSFVANEDIEDATLHGRRMVPRSSHGNLTDYSWTIYTTIKWQGSSYLCIHCWCIGTFVDGERLEKSAKAHVVPGKTVITIGRCANKYILLLTSNEKGSPEDGAEPVRGNARHDRDMKDSAGDGEGVPNPDHRRHNGSLEARRDGDVREHHHRSTGVSEARAGDRSHEHRNEALAQRQREGGRELASRGNADARPSNRDGFREEIRHRRPPEGSYRGAGYRDGPRDSGRDRDNYMRHDVQHDRARGTGRGGHHRDSGRGHHIASDSRRYEPSDRRDQQRRSERRSRSPKAQRRRSDADSEGEDEAQARAAEERRRKRKSAFDDAPASVQQQTPAQIVMGMMGGGGMPTGMLNAEQKKKLLWGKKAEPVEAAPVEAFGANRWDTAEFTNESEKEKFIKLMGVKKVPTVPTAAMATAQPASPTEREALTREKQDRLLHNVEAQFMAGLRRADGRTVGLGL